MNILRKNDEYYVISVKPENDRFRLFARFVNAQGKFLREGLNELMLSRKEAEKRVRRMKQGKRRDGWEEVVELPSEMMKWIPESADNWVSPQEMLKMVADFSSERYVVIKDVTGLEHRFDKDVEYLAKATDDESMLLVCDKFGKWVHCLQSRFSSITYTEEAAIAERMVKK